MSEYIVELDGKHSIALRLALAEEMRGGDFVRGEIVRCRDCRRYHPKEGEMLSCRFEYKDFVQWRSAEPDGYCAWGERKEGGE